MRMLMSLFIFSTVYCFSQNITDSNGRKQGPWSKVHPGTRVYQYKGQFKDDKPVGTFTYYYPSSKLKAIVKHSEGTNRAEAIYYHENGLVMSKGIYKDLKKDSVWSNYGPSGRLSNKETYKNDLLEGKKTVFYVPEDPQDKSVLVFSIANYKGGKLDGEYVEYFEGGSTKIKGSYFMDRKSGQWVSYDVTGTKMLEENYRNGLKHGWCMAFDDTGKAVGKQYYLDGRRIQGKELEIRMNQIKFNSKKSSN